MVSEAGTYTTPLLMDRRIYMKRRLLSAAALLLVLPMLFMIPRAKAAADAGTCGDGLTWVLEDDTLTISGEGEMDALSDQDTNVSAPSIWRDCKFSRVVIEPGVTSISRNAFAYQSGLKEVTIPDTVTYIGCSAFYQCTDLTSISIPASVRDLDDSAFAGCSRLETVELHPGLETIGVFTFRSCTALSALELPDTVRQVKAQAFAGCENLKELTFPKSVALIGGASCFFEESSITLSVQGIAPLETVTILNPDCEIEPYVLPCRNDAVIRGYSGSTAEQYAQRQQLEFEAISNHHASLFFVLGLALAAAGACAANRYRRKRKSASAPSETAP